MTQLALALAPATLCVDQLDEPYLYHDVRRPGFTAFVTPGGDQRQISLSLNQLPACLRKLQAGQVDAYIAQNEFFRPNRRAVNCWRLTSCYVDLDTYKLDSLYGRPAEALTDKLLRVCDDIQIPPPSIIIYSGRGLQAKWLLETPVPRSAMPRWSLVQRLLGACLAGMGADLKALDASRVLRLVGSVNSKSGEVVRIVHKTCTPTLGSTLGPSGVVVYDFDTLANELMPLSREQLAQRRLKVASEREHEVARQQQLRRRQAVRDSLVVVSGESPSAVTAQRLVPSKLAWDRLGDLRKLAELRNGQQGMPSKQRNTFVFLGACFLASALVAPAFRAEVRELAREFAPTWTPAEVQHCISPALSRLEAATRGEKVEFQGRQVDPRYRFSNKTLVDWLGITDEEMPQMTTILSDVEARRRDATRHELARRKKGIKPRAVYCGAKDEKAEMARVLRQAGKSLREIAREMGIGHASVSRYCADCEVA